MITTSDAYASVLEETQHWLNQAVIGLNLCPSPRRSRSGPDTLRHQRRHRRRGRADRPAGRTGAAGRGRPEQIDTTLLILPDAFDDFLDFNDFEEISNRLLKRMDLVGELQVATFHPQFQFADTEPDDIENCTNRSPYPILHLLREESIDRAWMVPGRRRDL